MNKQDRLAKALNKIKTLPDSYYDALMIEMGLSTKRDNNRIVRVASTPNDKTVKALQDASEGKYLTYSSLEEFKQSLINLGGEVMPYKGKKKGKKSK